MSRKTLVGGSVAALGLFAAAGAAAYVLVVRPWHRRWGATDEEQEQPLPGDDLVSACNFHTTRAITIDAPPEEVWSWLVQIGQGRAGFYSYDFLENMMDLDIRSASEILPEHQDLEVGDTIPLEPEGGGYTVAILEPGSHLVLLTRGEGESELDAMFRQAGASSTWAFVLQPLDDARTRLIVRWRARWDLMASPLAFAIGVGLDPIEFIMEQKMMRGIKERAEAAAQAAPT
jgi:hypothetical protein